MSLDAKTKTWLNQVNSDKSENNMITILKYIKENPGSSTDILRTELKMPHQTLTACLSNLMDCGILVVKGNDIEHDESFYSCYYFVEEPKQIIANQKNRIKIKFDIWVKRGLKDFVMFLDAPTLAKLEKCQETLKKAPILEDIIVKLDKKGQTTMFN